MERTKNYNLLKPGVDDFYDVDDFNKNADIVDQELKRVEKSVGEAVEELRGEIADIDLGEFGEALDQKVDIKTMQTALDGKEPLIRNVEERLSLLNADTIPFSDSLASKVTKKITFANLKDSLKAVFDSYYNKYVHPSYPVRSTGLYKVAVDGTGHVNTTAAVQKTDITALGIPGQDTVTPLSNAIDSTSTTTAATSYAVKQVHDIARPKNKLVAITNSGVWTPPRANMEIDIFMISGGGGGGGASYTDEYSSNSNSGGDGGGGGGGGYIRVLSNYKIISAAPIPVIIGHAGGGGQLNQWGSGLPGGDGGITAFGNISTIRAGKGGRSGDWRINVGGPGGTNGGNSGENGGSGYGSPDGTEYSSTAGAFCMLNNTLYGGSGGGGGVGGQGAYEASDIGYSGRAGGVGGDGGGGAGANGAVGRSSSNYNGSAGLPGGNATQYGGGGGGGGGGSGPSKHGSRGRLNGGTGGAGFQGLIIIAYTE